MVSNQEQDFEARNKIHVHENEHGNEQNISYTKKGFGPQTTSRPLSAVRLELALDEAGLSQTDLANKIDVVQSTISKIIDGSTKRSRYLPQIAKVLGKDVNWLAGTEPSDKNPPTINKNLLRINKNLFVLVPKYEIKNNRPTENSNESITSEGTFMIASTYLPQNIDSNALQFIEEPERAMQPDIKQGSIVTFNSQDITVKNGDIFVIRIGETVCSRILFSQPNGDILIRAKEPDFPDYVVKPQDSTFTVLGKVVFVTNRFN